jgi:N-acetylglucosamine-6-phosphate deacetylase
MSNKRGYLITHVKILGGFTPIENGWLLTEGDRIHSFGTGNPDFGLLSDDLETINGEGFTLLPGFIDLHTHGAMGTDFVFGSHDEIDEVTKFYAAHGVTSFLATTYSAAPSEMSAAISTIRSCMGSEPGARILGIHLEGPWLNPARAGAQDAATIRHADPTEVLAYLETGSIKLVAVAPEIKENQWLISACRQRGITVSAAHTDATFEEMMLAVQLGVTQVTHCFNAMSALHHREPGVVGAALIIPELRCELIADNIHVHPVVMKLLLNSKSPRGAILVTDSICAAGMPDGTYSLENQTVILKDSSARLADGTLAGSALTMDSALRNLVQAVGLPLDEIWRCASLNAAEAIYIADHKGKIEAGYDADLVLLDSNLHVRLTMREGKIIYSLR